MSFWDWQAVLGVLLPPAYDLPSRVVLREWDDLTARQPTAGGAAKSGWVGCVM